MRLNNVAEERLMPQIAPAATATTDLVRWPPARDEADARDTLPPLPTMLKRGLFCTCPACGKAKLFNGFLRVAKQCSACGTDFSQIRADDAPPYFTIFATGHIVVPLMLWLERAETPPLWVHSAIFLPLTVVLAMAMIRPIKGATIGGMLKLGLTTPDMPPRNA